MELNIGNIDRTIRIAAGIAAITLGLYFESWWGATGIVPLVTAFARWCPAYRIFGISSCGSSSCKASH